MMPQVPAVNPAEGSPSESPFIDGRFVWTVSEPLVKPARRPNDSYYSIKDPTVVRFEGRLHLFCTIRGQKRSHQIEYLSFPEWSQADGAERHILPLTNGYYCAPQVFFFSPHKKWYLIYQVQDPTRKPSLQPAYSTTTDLTDPDSWSKPKLLFDQHPDNVKMWIDFWVICDEDRAHLFFTSHAGMMWRSETSLTAFPRGWSRPKVALRGDIFEASHTYRLKGLDSYLTLIEAQAEGRRYFKAFTAPSLDGVWKPLASSPSKPFASLINVREAGPQWTTSFSHGELLRAGYDEKLEVDPDDLRVLFQGVASPTHADANYGEIPWKLGLLSLADSRKEFFYRRWAVTRPVFTPGLRGSFDEVAVKDPSVVFYKEKYHVFYTNKPAVGSKKYVDGCGYVAAATLEGLNTAKRYDIDAIVGTPVIAPQIFYFEPQRLWYLIAQTVVPGPSKLAPIFLTNPRIDDVQGWTKPKIIETNRSNDDGFWIDFWVICDEKKAHLFYTDHAGSMFRLETPIEEFPQGFSRSREHHAVTIRGRKNSIGPWRLHEASHIYYVKKTKQYLALLEAVHPHPTRRNYWDSRNRFMFAMTADTLEGPWRRVETEENDFFGIPRYLFDENGTPTTYDQVSHGELIRSGYDQKLEIDDYHLDLLFQAFDAADTLDSYDYDALPWELLLMRNY